MEARTKTFQNYFLGTLGIEIPAFGIFYNKMILGKCECQGKISQPFVIQWAV